ncbi:MAG: pyridoxal phosphate-dependent aminotransferase [Tannerella sp.]|jgi:cystathionine beta-lyase|nr:pyridoxal phosphate-dependent aminotransferase [Tannerella sp.]
MKQYDFDELIDRHGTSCVKVDGLKAEYGQTDLLPLWVADMDFRTPDFVVEALHRRLKHEIFGYTFPPESYIRAIVDWVKWKQNYEVRPEWLTYIPGIVKGLAFAIDCFTEKGDGVVIQPPIYPPFRRVPETLGRQVLENPLKLEGGRYRMDLDGLENLLEDYPCKALLLSSPHNPGGIVWDAGTLARLAEICLRHGLLVFSDEIHSEMAFRPAEQRPFPSVSQTAADHSITFMAPSKTFNIAGIVSSYAIVPNEKLREKFFAYLAARELNDGTIFAYTATEAAYTQGADWLRQMLDYVKGNLQFVDAYLRENIPAIKAYPTQASFLSWLDCRELGLKQEDLVALFLRAGLALNDGASFGTGGEGHMRLNVGCPRSILRQALHGLKAQCVYVNTNKA